MSIPPELGIIHEVLRLGTGVPDGSIPGGQAGGGPGKHMRKRGMSARINEASLQAKTEGKHVIGRKARRREVGKKGKGAPGPYPGDTGGALGGL